MYSTLDIGHCTCIMDRSMLNSQKRQQKQVANNMNKTGGRTCVRKLISRIFQYGINECNVSQHSTAQHSASQHSKPFINCAWYECWATLCVKLNNVAILYDEYYRFEASLLCFMYMDHLRERKTERAEHTAIL